jgi:hypothetical protein
MQTKGAKNEIPAAAIERARETINRPGVADQPVAFDGH